MRPIPKKTNLVSLFLDSGAYSASTKGVKIDIDEYIGFIKENQQYIELYANLDVIGDAKATWKNQQYMESKGLHPVPTFHYGEDPTYLEKYIAKYDYVALGGLVGMSTKGLRSWLDTLFSNYICDEKGLPKVKIHGFGLTSFELMWRYPWYSVDSTSWVLTGRFGAVFVPLRRNGKSIYDIPPWKVYVSNRSPANKEEGKSITTFTQMEREIILHYFDEKGFTLGKSEYRKETEKYKLKDGERWLGEEERNLDVYYETEEKNETEGNVVEVVIEEGLCNDYKRRDELNIIYFLDLEKSMPTWPWAWKEKKSARGFGL